MFIWDLTKLSSHTDLSQGTESAYGFLLKDHAVRQCDGLFFRQTDLRTLQGLLIRCVFLSFIYWTNHKWGHRVESKPSASPWPNPHPPAFFLFNLQMNFDLELLAARRIKRRRERTVPTSPSNPPFSEKWTIVSETVMTQGQRQTSPPQHLSSFSPS